MEFLFVNSVLDNIINRTYLQLTKKKLSHRIHKFIIKYMMTITNEQMDSLALFMRLSFETSCLTFLKKNYSPNVLDKSDEQLLILVRDGITKAESYKIINSKSVLHFLEYIVILGENFEKEPGNSWCNSILRIRNITGEEKVRRMMNKYPLNKYN
jgi:hypothetical protein